MLTLYFKIIIILQNISNNRPQFSSIASTTISQKETLVEISIYPMGSTNKKLPHLFKYNQKHKYQYKKSPTKLNQTFDSSYSKHTNILLIQQLSGQIQSTN